MGLILWEMLAGKLVWHHPDGSPLKPVQLISKYSRHERPSLDELPAGIDPAVIALMQDCWAQDPVHRPTADELWRRMSALDPNNPEHVEIATYRLLAKVPVMAAYAHKKSIGQAFLYPQNELGYVENFLRLTFGNRAEEYELNPVVVKALERLLILHEDHEQNASTSTVRLVGSTDANLFASVSAGISALFGPQSPGDSATASTFFLRPRRFTGSLPFARGSIGDDTQLLLK
jgi:citrate synthase